MGRQAAILDAHALGDGRLESGLIGQAVRRLETTAQFRPQAQILQLLIRESSGSRRQVTPALTRRPVPGTGQLQLAKRTGRLLADQAHIHRIHAQLHLELSGRRHDRGRKIRLRRRRL